MEFLLLAEAAVTRHGSWKLVTQLSKWAPNKARKEKPQLHILKLFVVPGDGLGRLQLALMRLTLYSDTGDHLLFKNLVVQTSCTRNKSSPRPSYSGWPHTPPASLFCPVMASVFLFELLCRSLLGTGVLCLIIGPVSPLITWAWLNDKHVLLRMHIISEESFC